MQLVVKLSEKGEDTFQMKLKEFNARLNEQPDN